MTRRAAPTFVQLVPEAWNELVTHAGLTLAERAVLAHLVLDADWRTNRFEDFTATDYARSLGIDRRSLTRCMKRLHELKLIDATLVVGHAGQVEVTCRPDVIARAEPRERPGTTHPLGQIRASDQGEQARTSARADTRERSGRYARAAGRYARAAGRYARAARDNATQIEDEVDPPSPPSSGDPLVEGDKGYLYVRPAS